jgi:hypothetical protein
MSESEYESEDEYDPLFDIDRTRRYDDRWHGAQFRSGASSDGRQDAAKRITNFQATRMPNFGE